MSAACLAWPAGAQNEGPPASSDDPIEREIITVYGTSNPVPLFDYPGQVSVVRRADIDTFAPSAVSDLLRDLPGVEFSGGPRRSGETPSLRGLGRENVLILLDGARQSFLSAHDGRFFLDPELIRSAEAVRGPASALYGSGAVGGVLAFESVDAADFLAPDETIGTRFRIGYQGVNDESFVSLTGFARYEAVDAIASFGWRNSNDIRLGSGIDLASEDSIFTTLVKANAELSPALAIEGSWQRFANTAYEPNNGEGVVPSNDPVQRADVEKDIETDTFRLTAMLHPPGSAWIDGEVTLYNAQTGIDEFDAVRARLTSREINTIGLSARNAASFQIAGVEATLTLGGDWYRDEQSGRDDASADGTRGGVPDGEQEFMGAFAQLEARADAPFGSPGDLFLTPGARYDWFESTAQGIELGYEEQAFSPRIGASYGPVDWLRVFASYSEGFRAPSLNDLYLDGVHFSIPHPVLFDPGAGRFIFINNDFVPNPNLRPEEAATIEFGAGVELADVFARGDRLTARASYYESDVEGLIDLAFRVRLDPSCFVPPAFSPCTAGTTNAANVINAELSGVEFEGVYEADYVLIRASFASIDGTDRETGADLGVLTPDRFNLDMRWRSDDRRIALGARLHAAGAFSRSQFDRDVGALVVADERDAYAVADLYATWRPRFVDGLRVDAGVDNVFDEDYERVFAGVSEPGSNPRIAISWTTTR